jgi:hypothetical protein
VEVAAFGIGVSARGRGSGAFMEASDAVRDKDGDPVHHALASRVASGIGIQSGTAITPV